jgi:hypothetical protein
MRTVPLSVLRSPARLLARLACVAAVASCGGAPTKVHTDAPAWEPPDTFDDLPRNTASRSPSPEDSPGPAPEAEAHSAPEPARTVTVGHRVVPLGAKIEVSSRMAIQALFSVESPNGTATVEDYQGMTDHHTLEVLQRNAEAASKVRVTYDDKTVTAIVNGRQKRIESPLRGKTYVLEAREGGLAITDEGGQEVTAQEGTTLSREFRGLGGGDETERVMRSAPMRLGAESPALAEALKKDFARTIEGRIFFGRVTVTPAGVRRVGSLDCVAFSVVLQVGVETKDRKVRMDMKGELLARTDSGWPVSIDLGGPVAVDLVERGIAAHGEGKSRFTGTYVFP